jgi:hypothetical protein
MISAVAPIWDGNETALVASGVILWGAFPVVYSTLMSAFYLPVLLMLAGLILRGVASNFGAKPSGCAGPGIRPSPVGRSLRHSCKASWSAPWWKACRSQPVITLAANEAGSVPLRRYAASASVSATRFSAPAGLSGNVKARCAT